MNPPARFLIVSIASAVVHMPSAQAHTLGNRHVSQLLEVQLSATGVTLRLTVDAPPEQWADYGGAADPVNGSLDRLRQGLMVVVDDATVPIRVVESRPNWDLASGASTLTVMVVAEADLRGHHTLRVGNANLSETPNYLNDELTVPPGAWVHKTSLLRQTATGAWADRSGVWAQYEALRSVSIDATLPQDPLTQMFAATRGGVWRLDDARERPLHASWREGRDTPGTVLLASFVALVLAAAGTRLLWCRRLTGLALLVASAAWVTVACDAPFLLSLVAVWLVGCGLGAASRHVRPSVAAPVVYGAGAIGVAVAVARLIG